ncbi:MAG: DUF1329 domain-containing protein [Pseudomonadales bacterium]|nr:DUF1329 domain-containing protein [Pseudomonadales bacterium]
MTSPPRRLTNKKPKTKKSLLPAFIPFFLLILLSTSAQAKVTPEEADRLCKELTCMGAKKQGNAAGTIPAFSGRILGKPSWVKYKGSGDYYANPYPNEKPLFTITAENYEQYRENLSDGQIALFKAYPSTFFMKVYPSKRDTRYSDFIYDNVKRNAVTAEEIEGGNGIRYAFGGPPFPLPSTGRELIWNHEYSPNPKNQEGNIFSAAVYNNGTTSTRNSWESRYFTVFDPAFTYETFDGVSARVMVITTGPARDKGKVTLVHEYKDLT